MTPDTDPKDAALHDLVKDWEQKVGSGRPWSRDMTVALVDRLIAERKALRTDAEAFARGLVDRAVSAEREIARLCAWQKAAAEERIRIREAGHKMRAILRMKPRPDDEEVEAALAWDRASE